MKTKAAVLVEQNKPLEIMELNLPVKIEVGQVLVQIYAAGICGAQIGEITGAKGPDLYLPHLLGHEGAGIVRACGAGVRNLKFGDHVVAHWRKGNGIESATPIYWDEKDKRSIGAGPVATFTKYAVVSENRLTKISDDVPFDIACLFGCAVTTGLGIVQNEAKIQMGESIVVAGCGGVGLNVIQGARMRGAYPIIGLDRSAYALERAYDIGASHVFSLNDPKTELYGEGNLLQTITKLVSTDGISIGPNVFVDCTGDVDIAAFGWGIINPGGRCILAGQPRYDTSFIVDHMRKNYIGKTLLDSQGGLTNPTVDIPRYAKLWQASQLDLGNQITHRFQLEDINGAIALMRSGKTGRCILEMG